MIETLNLFGKKLVGMFGDLPVGIQEKSQVEKQKEHIFSSTPFCSVLPYVAFDEECGLFINNSSCGFVIEAIPLVGGHLDAYKILQGVFQEVLEEGASIQCLLWADHRIDPFLNTWEAARQEKEIYASIAKNRVEYFKHQKIFSPRLFRFILSYSLPSQNSKLRLKEIREKIFRTIQTFTYAFSWKPKDLIETVGGLVNFNFSSEVVKRSWNRFENLSNQIPGGGELSVHKEGLSWGDALLKTFRVSDTPSQWSPMAMQQLIGDVFRDSFRINYPFFIHYGFHFPNQTKAESFFWRRSHLIENQGKSYTLIRLIPELAEELKECDFVRRSLSQNAHFVWTQFSTGIWANAKEMQQATQSMKNLFKINQFRLEENTRIHLPNFLSILPMAWGEYVKDLKELNILKTTISTECSNFIPIQGEWTGTPSPNGVLLTGRRGQLLNWNPFDSKSGNYNAIVVGRSGSGKSVFMQELLYSGLSMGANVYVLDVGRSFEKMCEIFEGQFIEFSKESNICLNPFSNISLDDDEEKETYFSFLKSIISCMAAPTQGTNDHENALIEMAISDVWAKKKNTATISDIAHWLSEKDDAVAKKLGVMLTPYTSTGSYARYFEGKNNVNFSNQMVLIELEELKNKPDLQTVVLQLFIMTIANKAFLGDRKTPFFICIDEAWDLLRAKQTGPFIETLARRVKKYQGSLIVGTQSMDDFFTTPGAKAAFDNSDWMCLLAQKNATNFLSENGKVKFDEFKQKALESVSVKHGEYSEIMICDGNGNYSINRLNLDPFSRLLYSTQAQDYSKNKDLKKAGKTITQAIQQALLEKGEGSG